MQTACFIFYLLLFTCFIAAASFFKNAGLGRWKLVAIFYIKIAAGIAYGLFYKLPKYYEGADTWRFYRLSLPEKQWLLKDPVAFFKDIFIYGYNRPGNLFAGENSYWNDLKSNVPVKLMAVMNVFTNSSYYTNIILFNFLFIAGLVALFKFFNQIFPGKKSLITIGIFLLPSTLFWCSGIHKDGLILSALGFTIYSFHKIFINNRVAAKQVIIIFLCLALIFSLRNYVAIALLAALFPWWLSSKYAQHKWLVFGLTYSFGIILFFSLRFIIPVLNFPAYIVEKQFEFLKLQGSSVVHLPMLLPTFTSFAKFLPYALDMAFLRPHITEARNLSYIPAAAENILFIIILLSSLFLKRTKNLLPSAFLFCLFFSVSILLISGYTITLSGAIVRYRSIVLPLLITPLLCMIDLEKFRTKRKLKPVV